MKRIACLIALLALMITGVACGDDDAEACMTTNDAAQQGLTARMQRSADDLPWPVAFALQRPGAKSSGFTPSPVPRNDQDTDPEQPYSWGYTMWVLLPPDVPSGQAVDAFESRWRAEGYEISSRSDGNVKGEDRDGFVYVTNRSVQDYLSLSIESPCFPKSQLKDPPSWPDRIESGN